MRAGDLDRVLVLQHVTEDPYNGEPNPSYSTFATVRAKATFETGKEFFQSGQTFSTGRALFLIRWRDDVGVKDRAILDGGAWNVESVREVGRRVALELMASRTQ